MRDRPKPRDFALEEANPETVETQLVDAGEINEWWRKDPKSAEKSKARPLIASTVVVIWALIVAVTAIRSILAGDLLILVPPAIISVPLTIILKFYFEEGKH